MDKYYYFVAQLPFLLFSDKPAITSVDFLQEASKWLKPSDLENLARLAIDDFHSGPGDRGFSKLYKEFELNFRKNLLYVRGDKKAPQGYQLPQQLTAALSAGNPLEVEKALFSLRWKFIESQEIDHFFDLEYLKMYFLKLQILERLGEFNKDRGTSVFDDLCEVQL